jgi:uncharacterized SAM-binding protein YcdF (DUF218 family)
MNNHTQALAEKIWTYHRLGHSVAKADAILVLCSHDEVVAERGAQLFLEGWAPLLIFSGGFGAITKALWTEPEAERFAAIAVRLGVPAEKILIENRSTNTGENVVFTRQLLATSGIDVDNMILVQKPYMERRSYAAFKQLWPQIDITVTSPQMTFHEYLDHYANHSLSIDDVISIMVGDLQRIKLYPDRGFQIYQEIPDTVWAAYEELVEAGFDRHLIKD